MFNFIVPGNAFVYVVMKSSRERKREKQRWEEAVCYVVFPRV